jgi:hypothetical protein
MADTFNTTNLSPRSILGTGIAGSGCSFRFQSIAAQGC